MINLEWIAEHCEHTYQVVCTSMYFDLQTLFEYKAMHHIYWINLKTPRPANTAIKKFKKKKRKKKIHFKHPMKFQSTCICEIDVLRNPFFVYTISHKRMKEKFERFMMGGENNRIYDIILLFLFLPDYRKQMTMIDW